MHKDPRKNDSQTRVNLFLDRDLDGEDENVFLKDLEQDEELGRTLQQEQKIRKLIKDNVASPGVPPDLVERIKNKFR